MRGQEQSLRLALRRALYLFGRYPFLFLLLQLPELSVHILADGLPKNSPQEMILSILFLFPYFCLATLSSATLTAYATLRIHENGEPPTLTECSSFILSRTWRLFLASLLVGGLSLLGIALGILPGLYFMTSYAFVPTLVAEASLPSSVYLLRSKKSVRPFFRKTLCLLLATLFAGAVADFFPGELSHLTHSAGLSVLYFIKLAAEIAVSSVGNLWMTQWYLLARKTS